MLEPCEVKISRRVLGGLGASNGPRLLDNQRGSAFQVTNSRVYGAICDNLALLFGSTYHGVGLPKMIPENSYFLIYQSMSGIISIMKL